MQLLIWPQDSDDAQALLRSAAHFMHYLETRKMAIFITAVQHSSMLYGSLLNVQYFKKRTPRWSSAFLLFSC